MNYTTRFITFLCTSLLCSLSLNLNADPMDKLVQEGVRTNTQAKTSQITIDKLSLEAEQLFSEFQLENKRIEDLKIYNAQLEKQLGMQSTKIAELKQSLKDVTHIERQIPPLLLRMIDGLEHFIHLDMPFLLEERQQRVQFLRNAIVQADVSTAEKFRQVIEAYNIENEYGNTIEAYKGTLQINGNNQEINFLRIGRIALFYQTLNGKRQGAWNQKTASWQSVDDRYRRDIRLGLKMAHKQTAPRLLKLPILSPEA